MIRIVYTTDDGFSDERWFATGKDVKPYIMLRPKGCWKRRRAYRDYTANAMASGAIYPRWSNAIRYSPKRHKEFHDLMAANGVPGCELNAKGQARIDGVEHQNAMMKVLRICNLDAGYRDLAPTRY